MNNTSVIHDTAVIEDSETGAIKVFRNAVIRNSHLGNGCSIGDDTTIERCHFENNVAINRRSYVNDSVIGKFSYTGINSTINFTKIGRFCSIARNVDIGGFDHDYRKVTTMPSFRFKQMLSGGGKIPEVNRHDTLCEIGNDVWIAAGAQILHKVSIGDGAVIGGGAIVTRDIPPYAIAVGCPARVIGYRCSEKQIEELLAIKWWNWPDEILEKNINSIIGLEINDQTITLLWNIKNEVG